MSQAIIVVPCDICGADENVQFYCVDCEENMCTNCNIYHSKIKKTKNDKVILISEAREENIIKTPVILCAQHSKEEVTIYCVKCRQRICTECLNGKHKGHNLTSLKQMKNTATDQLVNLRKKLKDRKLSNEETLKAEGKVHTEYMASIKQCRKDISDQKVKIIEELNIICEEEFAELTSLEEKEIKRYSEACTIIQKQQIVITTALQTVQNGIDTGQPASMLQAREDVTKSTERLDDFLVAQLYSPEFHQAHIERQVVRQHLGNVHTKSGGARLQIKTEAFKQKSEVKTSHSPDINRREVDAKKVRTGSIMKVKGKTKCINVIIPTANNCTWVSAQDDKNLTLINDKGDTIKTSVTVDRYIEDAKAYDNDILLTCVKGQQVFRLSEDGTTKSTFSNLHPYTTLGLCITNEMDVLVCLIGYTRDSKVVRLRRNGNIIQTIQKDSTGCLLYNYPHRVTTLPSGEILVTQEHNGKVTCVDKDGQHLFTWTGQVEGTQPDTCDTYGITQDSYNVFVTDFSNHKVYVLRKDGTGAKCLLDNTQGMYAPWGVALDDCGHLLVGCYDGKIHVIEY